MTTMLRFPAMSSRPEVDLHWSQAKNGPEILKKLGLSAKGNNTLFIGTKGMLLCGFGKREVYFEVRKLEDYLAGSVICFGCFMKTKRNRGLALRLGYSCQLGFVLVSSFCKCRGSGTLFFLKCCCSVVKSSDFSVRPTRCWDIYI